MKMFLALEKVNLEHVYRPGEVIPQSEIAGKELRLIKLGVIAYYGESDVKDRLEKLESEIGKKSGGRKR